jgi:hypothetical protein
MSLVWEKCSEEFFVENSQTKQCGILRGTAVLLVDALSFCFDTSFPQWRVHIQCVFFPFSIMKEFSECSMGIILKEKNVRCSDYQMAVAMRRFGPTMKTSMNLRFDPADCMLINLSKLISCYIVLGKDDLLMCRNIFCFRL